MTHAGIHFCVCSQWVPRESCQECGEQELKQLGAERVDFTKKRALRHLPSPFFALEVSSCDRPMTHGRAGSVSLLMPASPRAPNCCLKVCGPSVSSHTLREVFSFFLLGEGLLSNWKWPNWLTYDLQPEKHSIMLKKEFQTPQVWQVIFHHPLPENGMWEFWCFQKLSVRI